MLGKDEYLKKLDEELTNNNVRDKEKEEILNKYQKRYEFSLEADISEDEIEDMLGSPATVASKFKRDVKEDKVVDEEEVNYKSGYNLTIRTISDDIIFRVSNDDKNHIHFDDIDPNLYNVSTNSNDGIRLEYKKEKYLSLNRRSGTITISIPKGKVFDKIYISSVSGDVEGIDLAGKEINFQFTTADYKFHKLTADEITIRTVSGDVDIYNIESKLVLLNTVSGDIKVNAIKSNLTKIDAVSGDVIVAKLDGEFKYNTLSGDVKINCVNQETLTDKISKHMNKYFNRIFNNNQENDFDEDDVITVVDDNENVKETKTDFDED